MGIALYLFFGAPRRCATAMTLFFGGGARVAMLLCAAGFLAVVVCTSMVRISQPVINIDRQRSAEQATFQGVKKVGVLQFFDIGSINEVCLNDHDGMTHSERTASDDALYSNTAVSEQARTWPN